MADVVWDDEAAPAQAVAWDDEPRVPGVATTAPSTGGAALRGLGQGLTLGFGDELGALEQAALTKLTGRGDFGETYRKARDENRAENEAAKAAHPLAYYPSEVAGGAVTSFLPGLNIGRGASLGNVLLRTGAQGAAAGLGNSAADLTQGDVGGAAKDTVLGGAVGVAAGGLGAGLGALGGRAARGVANIDETVARKAAAEAAAETASARSIAGRDAQDAYKQLEHLRELGAKGLLTPEQAKVATELEAELAAKAQEKLLPAAARKAESAAAYADALASEGQRAKDAAAQKLSLERLKQVVGPRLLRYGLPALGGAVGLGHGGLLGAGEGALMGAGMRPMMHSLIRAGRDPAVARPLLRGASAVLGGASPVVERAVGAETQALAPTASAIVDPRVRALVAALRGEPAQEEVANAP